MKFSISEHSDKAIYIQLKYAIKENIINGKYPPLSKLPTISEIASASGVSMRTVYIALQELIDEGICFRRPKKGTFVSDIPNVLKSQLCGVITNISPIANPLRTLLYCGIVESAAVNNISTFTINIPDSEKKETPADIIRRFDNGNEFDMNGIFMITQFYNNEIRKIAEQFPEKRFFYLNYQGEWLKNLPANMAAVVNDDFAGAYNLAKYISAEYKIKNAVILTIPLPNGDLTYFERVDGMRKALAEENIELISEIVINSKFSHFNGQLNAAFETVKQFFDRGGRTDFILCVNDLFAQGAKNAVEECGLKGKIHVSGYDCLFNQLNHDFPTVRVAYTEMGRIALQQMLSDTSPMQTVTKLVPEIITLQKGEK